MTDSTALFILHSTEGGMISLAMRFRLCPTSPTSNQKGKHMKAVGYVRISKSEAGSASLETQEASIRHWATANGHELLAVYRDDGVSGGVAPLHREGASQALRESRKRECGCLVVSKLDRLSRDLRDILALVDDELGHRATLISVSEGFDARTPSGRMFLQLLGTFGEFERGRIQERTKDALAARRRDGRKTGGVVPFGYRAKGGLLVPLAKEQRTLRRARELRADGLSWVKVANALNAEKLFRRNGGDWNGTKLFETLMADDRRVADMAQGNK